MTRRHGGSSDHDLKACPLVRNESVAGPEAGEKRLREKGGILVKLKRWTLRIWNQEAPGRPGSGGLGRFGRETHSTWAKT